MKITRENYQTVIPKNEQELLNSLFDDLDDINRYHPNNKLYIEWQNWHDEYSCERTDPCPDFYGYYSLKFENLPNETVGTVMTINDLDSTLCVLFSYNYLQNMGSEINNSIIC